MPIAPGDAVVADANVLLSAALGKAALRVFTRFGIVVHSARFNIDEVEEYLPRLSRRYGLPELLVQLQWRLLPITVHEAEIYDEHLDWARGCLADRDIEDSHPLALARCLQLPLWTNDRDLEGHGIECLPTARLLKMLEN